MSRHRVPILLSVASLAAGCTVGPDYQQPQAQTPVGWAGLDPQATPGPIPSTPTDAEPGIASWWSVFNDPILTSLIERAAAANFDLAQAEARIRQARAERTIAASGAYPSLDVGAAVTRSRVPSRNPSSITSNFYRVGFDAAWEIDVFGGVRRAVEAAEAHERSTIEDRRDVLVTLAGEVAVAYMDLRGAQQELEIANRNLDLQRETLGLTQQRYDAGFVSFLDVANAQAQVATTSARIPVLDSVARQSIYALGVLLGDQPAALLAELTPKGEIPVAPAEIPVGLPSELLQRRPDIRRADADLHQATAEVGVAVADLYPKFSINASVGLSGSDASSLVTIADHFWSIGPGVSYNVFDGGKRTATVEVAKAVTDQSLAAYKQTVLGALRDVETSLTSFTNEQLRRAALHDSVAANRRAVELSNLLYSEGKTDFLDVLVAQRLLLEAEDQLSLSETAVSTDLVSLYKALGGGWDENEHESPPAHP